MLEEKTKSILQEWIDKQGHDRCWYYPELFRRLIALYQIVPSKDPMLPPEKEFEAGCKKYRMEEYDLAKHLLGDHSLEQETR